MSTIQINEDLLKPFQQFREFDFIKRHTNEDLINGLETEKNNIIGSL